MLDLSLANLRDLSSKANKVIEDVLVNGGARSKPPRGEVSAVSSIVLDGFDGIANSWNPELIRDGYKIDLTAVFTHCRPWVTSSVGRCELADLLIVVDDRTSGQHISDRRAVLVQAKRLSNKKPAIKGKRDEVQFDLMFGWPSFTFEDPAYDKKARNFKSRHAPGDPSLSGEYGWIDLNSTPRHWVQYLTMNARTFTADQHLGQYIAHMVSGTDSYGREAKPGGLDDWSYTVDELLQITANRASSDLAGAYRGQSHRLGLITSLEFDQPSQDGGGGTVGEDGESEIWSEGPISVVHMTASRVDARD